MPPHCDTLDGPVVSAAKRALEAGRVNLVLPWAPKEAEGELKKSFEKALRARSSGGEAAEVADLWFFENVVRLHRRGEGAPYTGLKPAGLDWGPVVPRADKAVEKGDVSEVVEFLKHAVQEVIQEKFDHAVARREFDENDVDSAREYVHAMLEFVLFSAHLYIYMNGEGAHGEEGALPPIA